MKATFRFSPRILARLGEELNQSLDQSILELVKNSYDADASNCTVEFFDVSSAGGRIVVTDDGLGMEPDQIINGWLVLGKSGKESARPTKKGRFPAGNKGLGRLAALRLGREVRLSSISAKARGRKHELEIQWANFDDATVVENVPLSIVTRPAKGRAGTQVCLNDLRAPVDGAELRRLARSLVLLTDPFSDGERGFTVRLVAQEFADSAALVNRKYFDLADYHLHATIDGNGNARAEILDWQGSVLAEADLSALRQEKSPRRYRAPKLDFDLWAFLLGPGAESFSTGKASKADIRAWLGNFGGVHVYERGIRVTPYGNSGDDWLEMNLARVRSPEERPSTNTSIGRVVIHPSSRYELTQKTDRSGFIEDPAFVEMRTFARDALNWMARWRLKQAEIRREREKNSVKKAAVRERSLVEAAIEKVPASVKSSVLSAFHGYERTRDRESEALRKEVQLYRTLSTAGITAATFAHESQGNPLKRIEMGITTLQDRVPRLVKGPDRGKLLDPVSNISDAASSLSVLSSATLSLVKSSKRRLGRVEVHHVIAHVEELLAPFLKGRGAALKVQLGRGNPFLRASEAAIESILTNLINNSLAAFERAGSPARIINLRTTTAAGEIEIVVSDTGPGIADLDVNEIWLPGITSNSEGTGLGLTIVRDTVRDLAGTAKVEPHGRDGGAEFQIVLPILGR